MGSWAAKGFCRRERGAGAQCRRQERESPLSHAGPLRSGSFRSGPRPPFQSRPEAGPWTGGRREAVGRQAPPLHCGTQDFVLCSGHHRWFRKARDALRPDLERECGPPVSPRPELRGRQGDRPLCSQPAPPAPPQPLQTGRWRLQDPPHEYAWRGQRGRSSLLVTGVLLWAGLQNFNDLQNIVNYVERRLLHVFM